MLDAYISTVEHTRNQTLKLVADLTDEQLVVQPAPKTNHPAWVLGHLLAVDVNFYATLCGGDKGPFTNLLDEQWGKTYGGGSTPLADKSLYKPKAYYVEKLKAVREAIMKRLKALKPEDLDREHPDPARRQRFPTVGHAIFLYGTWHEAYHAGQLSTWRRVQGLPAV